MTKLKAKQVEPEFTGKLKKNGNSLAVIIPLSIRQLFGLKEGRSYKFSIVEECR